MRLSILTVLCVVMGVSACSTIRDSRVNPANWFGRGAPEEPETITNDQGEVVEVNPLIGARNQRRVLKSPVQRYDPNSESIFRNRFREERPYEGTLVLEVTALDILPTTSGAIVSVEGVTARQGAFDVRLVAANDGVPVDGVLTLELRALQPPQTDLGPEPTRRVTVGAALSTPALESIESIRVVARNNARTRRR